MASNQTDRAWELMHRISICMLTTWDGSVLRARPMSAHIAREENCVYFLSDVMRERDDQIRQFPQVSLSFSDPASQKYVSVAAHATVSNNREKIRELFSTPAKAWWNSPDHPNIRVLKATPMDAEYWDGPGAFVSHVNMAADVTTDTGSKLSDNRQNLDTAGAAR